MLNKLKSYNWRTKFVFHTAAALVLVFWAFAVIGNAQTTDEKMTATVQPAQKMVDTKPAPVLTNYKEVKIGTTAKEVRDKLGKAEIDDKDGFYYQISKAEFAQIRVDKDKKVRLISVTYTNKNKDKPQYSDVFGADAVEAAQPDGSVYKLVRYPQAGYWVAYSRTAGENPSVTITMQKMQAVK